MSETAHLSRPTGRRRTPPGALVGSGDRIALFVAPLLVAGVVVNALYPALFQVGGPPFWSLLTSALVVVSGVVIWAWSVALILIKVPRGELISDGPYAWLKHPIYTGVALLVLPWVGFLCNTWLGAVLGVVLYIATRMYAPAEETELSSRFGVAWEQYRRAVKLPWL